ncbi:MAG TPA: VOC family protein [Balneolales bacterium]|nr:VOC family protein [Balneolales bacterium]
MTFNKLTPKVMVDDINKTITFYRNVLGFELINAEPDNGDVHWAMMKRDEIEIMFQTRNSISKDYAEFQEMKTNAPIAFYIDLDNVNKLYSHLKDKTTTLSDLHITSYGAVEFSIRDCNGYILTFAQSSTADD